MEMPKVLNVLNDSERNIRYEVVAYRQLSERELLQAVRMAVSMMKKKPKKNTTYTFQTIIGIDR
jgi:hypothetical protein